jgi:hypothetical protein
MCGGGEEIWGIGKLSGKEPQCIRRNHNLFNENYKMHTAIGKVDFPL